jgi:NhaC family Na+:H+ antiporter
MTGAVEKIDWTSEVEKLRVPGERNDLKWFSPNPGQYKIEVVEEGGKYVTKGYNSDKDVHKMRFVIRVNGGEELFNWGVTLSGSYTSLWGQLVLIGSLKRMPTLPVMFISIGSASFLALAIQPFSLEQIIASLHKGFHTDMAPWATSLPLEVMELVNRGGLYYLAEAVITAMIIFIFIGAMDHINAMPIVIDKVFGFAQSRSATILSTLVATAFTNAMTSNQYATTFIVGDAFKTKFDQLKIHRKVLSRSLEDTGTMLESIVPWTPTALFIVMTLGVPVSEYWHWQFLSLINFMIAPALAITGIGCLYNEKNSL